MPEEQLNQPVSYGIGLKIRDIERSQEILKDRVLLIGQNFIETQEKNNKQIIELKKQAISLESDLKRITSIIESLSEETAKSARKEELAILARQFKMFEPLNFARQEDIDQLIDKKLDKHKKTLKEEHNPHHFWSNKL